MKKWILAIVVCLILPALLWGAAGVDTIELPATVDTISEPASVDTIDLTYCTPACENSNITLFWRCEGATLNTSQLCDSNLDYNSSGADPTYDCDASFTSSPHKTQSNALDLVTGGTGCSAGDCRTWDFENGTVSNIWDGGNARISFWWYVDEFCDDNSSILYWEDAGSAHYILLVQTATNAVRFYHEDGSGQNCTTESIDVDEWKFVDLIINVTAGTAALVIYDDDGETVDGDCTLSSGVSDIGTPTKLHNGNFYGSRYLDQYIDQIIVSSDPNTSLWPYMNDTSYSQCD